MLSFWGLTNYCRAWIPNYAEVTGPLMDLMFDKIISMSAKLEWTPDLEESFCHLKQALKDLSKSALPDNSKAHIQTVD